MNFPLLTSLTQLSLSLSFCVRAMCVNALICDQFTSVNESVNINYPAQIEGESSKYFFTTLITIVGDTEINGTKNGVCKKKKKRRKMTKFCATKENELTTNSLCVYLCVCVVNVTKSNIRNYC